MTWGLGDCGTWGLWDLGTVGLGDCGTVGLWDLGRNNDYISQEKALDEIHRVLKPGGMLLFAENLKASLVHQLARKWFIRWGKSWRYLTLEEIKHLLSKFSTYEIHTTGFLSAFASGSEKARSALALIDEQLPFIPARWRYVGYGVAWK